MKLWVVIGFICAALVTFAAENVSRLVIDGVVYENVRWGPVNQGKVVFFHNHGVATIPIEKLPPEYQRQFGYDPQRAAASVREGVSRTDDTGGSAYDRLQRAQARRQLEATTAQERELDARRATQVVFNGQLVEKSKLTELVGFLSAQVELNDEDGVSKGSLLDLARLRESARNTPAQLRMRPGLWEKTGEQVLLKDYGTDELLGMLVRVYGQEGKAIRNLRTFSAGTEPTREQFQQLKK